MKLNIVERDANRVKYQVLDDLDNEILSRTEDVSELNDIAFDRGLDLETVLAEREAARMGAVELTGVVEVPDVPHGHTHDLQPHKHPLVPHTHPVPGHVHEEYMGALKELPEHDHPFEPHTHSDLTDFIEKLRNTIESDSHMLRSDVRRQFRDQSLDFAEQLDGVIERIRSAERVSSGLAKTVEEVSNRPVPAEPKDFSLDIAELSAFIREVAVSVDKLRAKVDSHSHPHEHEESPHTHPEYAKTDHPHSIKMPVIDHAHHWHKASEENTAGKVIIIYKCRDCGITEKHEV